MSQNLVRDGTNKEENNLQKDNGYRKLYTADVGLRAVCQYKIVTEKINIGMINIHQKLYSSWNMLV